MSKRSASRTSERAGSCGGSRPSSTDSTSDRALNGRIAGIGLDVTDVDRCDRDVYDAAMAVAMRRATMVPPGELLPDVLPTLRLNGRAMPVRPLRDELRRIPTARNVVTVAMALLQTF